MKKQIVAVVVMILGLGASLAWAQHQVEGNFKFEFIVDGKTMPAGAYIVTVDEDRVVLKSTAGGASMNIPVVTRIADRELPKPKFFFDKTKEGQYYLSELQLPGMDGFLFQGSPRPHTHEAAEATGQK
jgi:hypothetical protein